MFLFVLSDAEMQEALEVAVTAGDENIRRESQLYDGGVQLGFPWWIREHGALQNQTPSQYIVPSSSSSSSSSSNDHASLMNNAEAFFPSQRQDAAIQASDSSGVHFVSSLSPSVLLLSHRKLVLISLLSFNLNTVFT